jgi:hypothetical protein
MGRHSSGRWYLAPTGFLAVLAASGVVGVALGPAFVRPTVEFGSSVALFAEGGGQAGAVEPVVPDAPAPAVGARPVVAPTSTGRAPSHIPPSSSPAREPVHETTGPDGSSTDWLTRSPSHSPEPTPSSSPTAEQDPEQAQPKCGWSE